MDKKETNKPASITDVAKRAGVAVGTVSHALNSVGYVKAETREKILKAARELNYVPNRAGRILKTRQTRMIMLAIPDTSNEIYFGMIESVQRVLKEHDYSLLLYYTNAIEKEEMKALKMLQECVIDGLILVHFSYSAALLEEIQRCNSPIVLLGMCNHRWAGKGLLFDTVSIDVSLGIYNAVQHLIRAGHRRIGYLGGRKNVEVYEQRFAAYKRALEEGGIEYNPAYADWNDWTEGGGYISARRLMMLKDRPTAICASNDLQAIGCVEAAKDMGLQVPGDLALVGMDNINVMRILGMTSLKMQEDLMGEAAATMLMSHLEDEASTMQDQYFRPELVVRDSSMYFEK